MNMMNNMFQKYLDQFMLVFLDDILVYSKNVEEHDRHLRLVLQILKENQLFGKLSKCEFYSPTVHYLGHIIFAKGLVVDPKKIKAIIDWPAYKNVSEIRSFVGLVGYYKKFVKNFSKLVYPITQLERKGNKFIQDDKCDQAFSLLKQKLNTTPILKLPNPHKELSIYTNSSGEGLGGVLMQGGSMITYESCKLKDHEKNYATHDLKLATIIHDLKMLQHYLLG